MYGNPQIATATAKLIPANISSYIYVQTLVPDHLIPMHFPQFLSASACAHTYHEVVGYMCVHVFDDNCANFPLSPTLPY